MASWESADADLGRLRSNLEGATPFSLLGVIDDPEALLRSNRAFAQSIPAAGSPLWKGQKYRHAKIRIAYLSADFHTHATAYLIAELIELHDRDAFEVIGVSFGPEDHSELRARLRGAFDEFVDVSERSDLEIAQYLLAHEVDIAIDLKGYTRHSRPGMLALRPAPIQVNYLGYPSTMGASFIDYLVADPVVVPPEHRSSYSEKIAFLPNCYQVNDRKRPIDVRTPSRREERLPEDAFVFCSFSGTWKITPEFFSLWMRLLQAVPGSVLWLIEQNRWAVDNLRREAAARGIATERLVFAPFAANPRHLARHRLADLFLDTLPCNAHTTASDALWAGLPVLTCMGRSFAGRVGASLIHAVGLPMLVAESMEDYEQTALELARNPARLASLRAALLRNGPTSALFDTTRFCRDLETAYRLMWRRHQRGESPEDFTVGSNVTS
jgi:predicted O-linked N-acetylglucosamine transferase (SPINDLY family)